MGNKAVFINPPIGADIHITTRGSDWLWAVFSIFGLATLLLLFHGFTKASTDRIHHYLLTAVVLIASIRYFTQASDLGFTPIAVEFVRHSSKVSGATRQIFYVKWVEYALTFPLLLLDVLLTAALPWSHLLFVLLTSEVFVITFLIGSLVHSTYKWGYFTLGLAAFFYVAYTLILPARSHASAIGSDVGRAYSSAGLWLLFIWLLYPIAWGVSEGGNVISPDSEAVFYGILDIVSKIGVSALLLWGLRDVEPSRLGLRLRSYDEDIPGATGHVEKNGHRAAANV